MNSSSVTPAESPIVEAAEAIAATVADPSALTILSDFEIAYKLYAEFKANIAGLHPSVSNIFKALF